MAYSDETRRYLAKVSRVGIVAAVLYALIHGFLRYFPVYGLKFRLYLLTAGTYNVIPELAVAIVGVAALVVCGVLSLILRAKPAIAQWGWIIGGKALLLAAPVGYIRGQLLLQGMSSASSNQMDFLVSFAILATVFVGYAYGSLPRGSGVDSTVRIRPRRVWLGTLMVGGVMLASVLWLLLLTRQSYGSMLQVLSVEQQREYLLWRPLNASAPIALAVTLGYLVLSLAALWDGSSKKSLVGKGTAFAMWAALAVAAMDVALMILWQLRMVSYTAGQFYTAGRMQIWQTTTASLAVLLGLWALCRLLPDVKRSKTTLLGVRCILGIAVLDQLLSRAMGVLQFIAWSERDGVNLDTYSKWIQAETWGHLVTTLLTVAALCILAVGLTRGLGSGKGFWAVPALTVATVVLPLLTTILWELIMRGTDVKNATVWQTLLLTVIPAAADLIRALVGILALRHAVSDGGAAEEPLASAEPPKPRMEDYLYQL